MFYEIDEQLGALPKHPEARLWPSEVVTVGLLHARTGVGNRAFYRWLTRDYRALFPQLPERTRVWAYFQARLAFTMAAFNVLVQWYGFRPNASGFVPLSIAELSL